MDVTAIAGQTQFDPTLNGAGNGGGNDVPAPGSVDFAVMLLRRMQTLNGGTGGANLLSSQALMSLTDGATLTQVSRPLTNAQSTASQSSSSNNSSQVSSQSQSDESDSDQGSQLPVATGGVSSQNDQNDQQARPQSTGGVNNDPSKDQSDPVNAGPSNRKAHNDDSDQTPVVAAVTVPVVVTPPALQVLSANPGAQLHDDGEGEEHAAPRGPTGPALPLTGEAPIVALPTGQTLAPALQAAGQQAADTAEAAIAGTATQTLDQAGEDLRARFTLTVTETADPVAHINPAASAAQSAQEAMLAAELARRNGTQNQMNVSVSNAAPTGPSLPQTTAALAPSAVLAVPMAQSGLGQNTGDENTLSSAPHDASQTLDAQVVLAPPVDANVDQSVSNLAAPLVVASGAQAMAQSISEVTSSQTEAITGVQATGNQGASQPQQAGFSMAPGQGFQAAVADKAEAPQAPQQVREPNIPVTIDQIKVLIAKSAKDGIDTIKVQLNPQELGRVEVKIEVQNGQAKATITADRASTLQMLKNDSSGLQQALRDAGLNTDSGSLSFFLRGEQQRQSAQQQGNGNRRRGVDLTNDDDMNLSSVSAAGAASQGAGSAAGLDISV